VRTNMEQWTEIRRKVLVEGASRRSICREYHLSPKTLNKMLAHSEPPGYRPTVRRPKLKLDRLLPVIDEILEADKTAPPKQRHTGRRIFERCESWTEVLGSERLTGATLDRLTHRCRIIETKGESYRLQDAKARTSRTARLVTQTGACQPF
jgi:hypothetical protein